MQYTPLTVGAAALSALSVIFFIAAAGHPTMTTFDTASTTVGFGVFRYCLSDKTDECDYYSDGPDYHQLLGIEHFQARRRCSAAFLIFALFLSLAAGGGAVMLFLDKELGLLLGIAASGASAFCSLIVWAIWAQINRDAKLNSVTEGGPGASFGLTVTAFIFTLIAGVLFFFVRRDRKGHAHTRWNSS